MTITFLMLLLSLFSCNDVKTEQNPELKKSIERGTIVYEDFCMQCHLPNGKGVSKAFPPLDNSDYLMNKREESIMAIKYGLSGKIIVNGETYNTAMAALGLSDTEVADVMNYITNSWSNKNTKMITVEEVSKIQP
ncbi:MAG: c-type cytochrome [Aquaticitalea sp.]